MRKFVCISLMIAVLATSAFFLVACNSDDHVVSTGEFLKDVANRSQLFYIGAKK